MKKLLFSLLTFLLDKLILERLIGWIKEKIEEKKKWDEIKKEIKALKESKSNDEIIKHLRNLNI